jgi:hypothetical protein
VTLPASPWHARWFFLCPADLLKPSFTVELSDQAASVAWKDGELTAQSTVDSAEPSFDIVEGLVFLHPAGAEDGPETEALDELDFEGARLLGLESAVLPLGPLPPLTGGTIDNLSIDLHEDFAILAWVLPAGAERVQIRIALYALPDAPEQVPDEVADIYRRMTSGLVQAAG